MIVVRILGRDGHTAHQLTVQEAKRLMHQHKDYVVFNEQGITMKENQILDGQTLTFVPMVAGG